MDRRRFLSRRQWIVMLFVGFAVAHETLHWAWTRLFNAMYLGSGLDKERKHLEAIAANLPPEVDYPVGNEKAVVAVARNPELVWEEVSEFAPGGWEGRPNAEQVNELVDAAVVAATRTESVEEAYRSLFSPVDQVAIKVLWTVHLPMAEPVIRGLLSAGVAPENITMFDYRQLNEKWWSEGPDTPFLLAREPGLRGFNEYCDTYGVCVAGGDYDTPPVKVGSHTTHFDRVLYDCTALINLASCKTHFMAESTLCMKNHMGSHRAPHAFHSSIDASLALANAVPLIRDKTRLAIIDATAPIYDRGPQTRNSIYSWKYNGVLASRDPVAIDTVGVSILSEERAARGLPSEMARSHYQLDCAERLRLGRHDPAWIERVDLTLA